MPASRPGFGDELIRLPSSRRTNAHSGLTWSMTYTVLVPRFLFSSSHIPWAESPLPVLSQCVPSVAAIVGQRISPRRRPRSAGRGKRLHGALQIEVADVGSGFDPGMPNTGGHFGMDGMRERVQLLGGNFEVKSAPNQGALIRASLPLLEAEEAHF